MKKGSLYEKLGEMVIMSYYQGTDPENIVAINHFGSHHLPILGHIGDNEPGVNIIADVSDVYPRISPATVFWHEIVGPCLARQARLHLGLLFASESYYYSGESPPSLYIYNAGPYVRHCFF